MINKWSFWIQLRNSNNVFHSKSLLSLPVGKCLSAVSMCDPEVNNMGTQCVLVIEDGWPTLRINVLCCCYVDTGLCDVAEMPGEAHIYF